MIYSVLQLKDMEPNPNGGGACFALINPTTVKRQVANHPHPAFRRIFDKYSQSRKRCDAKTFSSTWVSSSLLSCISVECRRATEDEFFRGEKKRKEK